MSSRAADGFAQLKASVKERGVALKSASSSSGASSSLSAKSSNNCDDDASLQAYLAAESEKRQMLKEGVLGTVHETDIVNDVVKSLWENNSEEEKMVILAESNDGHSDECGISDPLKEYRKVYENNSGHHVHQWHHEANGLANGKTVTTDDTSLPETADNKKRYMPSLDTCSSAVSGRGKDGLHSLEETRTDKKCKLHHDVDEYAASQDGFKKNFSHLESKNLLSEPVVQMNLTDEDINQFVSALSHAREEELAGSDSFTPRSLSLSENSASGYIGEKIAFNLLQKQFANRDDVEMVEWLNAEGEQGNSYDIAIRYVSKRVQKCEVKTHITRSQGSANQWFISPQEVQTAGVEKEDFFCLFISLVEVLEQDASPGTRHGYSQVIGFQHGFMNAIQSKDVSLIVQVNNNTQN